jgi:hypothetical protein
MFREAVRPGWFSRCVGPEIRAALAIAAKVSEKSQAFMTEFIEETTHGAVTAVGAGGQPAAPCGCG